MYDEMLEYVKNYLEESGHDSLPRFPFRKRSLHCRRVYNWAKRLISNGGYENINKEALLIAAIFHDIGYGYNGKDEHATYSANLCRDYLKDKGFSNDLIELVYYLIINHSNKKLLKDSSTKLELILLMEADLLDETGALSIIWDAMMEGNTDSSSFYLTYQHILNYSYREMNLNPMVTNTAKAIWRSKQLLVNEFVTSLSYDLGIIE